MNVADRDSLRAALERLHLLEPDILQALSRRPEAAPRDLAGWLVKAGHLTPFQANQILNGKGDSLLLGSYVLLERVGEGGMGAVFKARNWKLGRVVALKLIRKDRLANDDIVRRFRREIEAAARLDHPHIVRAHDADQVGDTHFLVMEHVEGVDLSRLVKTQGPLPAALACDYVRQAALGLQHAFEKGMIHRDIKPSNLILANAQAAVKILDFGLARLAEASDDGERTASGVVMGSPDYISPEQARESHGVDIRADLYSLGCTLYFLLAGRPPFPSGSLGAKLLKQQTEEPPPFESLRPDVPASVVAIVRKLMAKQPERRYQTPAELVAALESRTDEPPSATALASKTDLALSAFTGLEDGKPVSRPRRQLTKALAAAGVMLLAGVALAFLLHPRPKPDSPDSPTPAERTLDDLRRADIPDRERIVGQPKEVVAVLGRHAQRHWGAARCVAVSPDGKLVASGGMDHSLRLWHADTMGECFRTREHNTDIYSLAFSPDGSWLASGTFNNHVILWRVADSRLRLVHWVKLEGFPPVVAFLDSRTLLAGAANKLVLLDCASTPPKERDGPPVSIQHMRCLAVGADGKRVVVSGDGGFLVYPRDKDKFGPPRLACKGAWIDHVAFADEGQELVVADRQRLDEHWDVAPDPPRKRGSIGMTAGWSLQALAAAPRAGVAAAARPQGGVNVCRFERGQWRGLHGLQTSGFPNEGLAFSPDGRLLFASSLDGAIRRWTLDGLGETEPDNLEGPIGPVSGLTFIGDGRTLAVAHSRMPEVRLWDLRSSSPSELPALTLEMGFVRGIASAPDGLLALMPNLGPFRFWDTAETPPRERATLAKPANPGDPVALSADGRTLAALDLTLGPRVWKRDGEQWKPTPDFPKEALVNSAAVALSPAGDRLAVGNVLGEAMLWDVQEDAPRLLARLKKHDNTVNAVAFSADGRLLASAGGTTVALWEMPAQAGEKPRERAVFFGHRDYVQAVAFSPDGRRLASSGNEGLVFVWDAEKASPKPLREFPLAGPVHRLAFAPDGRHLATGNGNGTVYILRWEEK